MLRRIFAPGHIRIGYYKGIELRRAHMRTQLGKPLTYYFVIRRIAHFAN
jgi:hypothetical protein